MRVRLQAGPRERRHNGSKNKRPAKYFEDYDLGKIAEIEGKSIPYWYPPHKMMNVEDGSEPWGAEWREQELPHGR